MKAKKPLKRDKPGRPALVRKGPIMITTITEEVTVIEKVRENHGSLVNGVRFAAKNKPKR